METKFKEYLSSKECIKHLKELLRFNPVHAARSDKIYKDFSVNIKTNCGDKVDKYIQDIIYCDMDIRKTILERSIIKASEELKKCATDIKELSDEIYTIVNCKDEDHELVKPKRLKVK